MRAARVLILVLLGVAPAVDGVAAARGAAALEEAKAHLAAGRVHQAREAAERADRKSWDALAIQAAYWSVLGKEDEHDAVLKKLQRLRRPRRHAESAAAGATAPRPGDGAYVAATRIRLRAGPSAGARIEAELPINSELRVLSVKGDWAEVEGVAPPAVVLAFAGEPRSFPEARARGFLMWKYLSAKRLEPAALIAEAKAEEAKGRVLAAARRLERAMTLAPDDRAIRQALARVATAAGEYELAMHAALPMGKQQRQLPSLWSLRHEVTLTHGCVGNPLLMTTVDGEDVDDGRPHVGNGCLVNVDRRMVCPPSSDAPPETLEEWERARDAAQAANDAVDAVFSGGPLARFTITPDTLYANSKQVWAYALPYRVDPCEPDTPFFDLEQVKISTGSWTKGAPGMPVTIWVQLPSATDHIFGLVAADGPEEARERARIVARSADFEPWRDALRPMVIAPPSACLCDLPPVPDDAVITAITDPEIAKRGENWASPEGEVRLVRAYDDASVWLNLGDRPVRFKQTGSSGPAPEVAELQPGKTYWRTYASGDDTVRLDFKVLEVLPADDCVVSKTQVRIRLKRQGKTQESWAYEQHGC